MRVHLYVEHVHLNEDFSIDDLTRNWSSLRPGKASGPDGVLEFLVYLDKLDPVWFRSLMSTYAKDVVAQSDCGQSPKAGEAL